VLDEQLGADAIWQEWFEPLFTYIEENRDVIGILAYINTHWDAQPMWGSPYTNGYWGDTRLQNNPTLVKRWNERIKKIKMDSKTQP